MKIASTRKKIITILLVTTAIFCLAAGYVYVRYVNDTQQPSATTELSDTEAELALREKGLKENDDTSYADYLLVGDLQKELGEYQKAEETYLQAEAMQPDKFDVLYSLAAIYRIMEDKESAVSYYEKLLGLTASEEYPQHPMHSQLLDEQEAIRQDNFELDGIRDDNDIPL